MPSSTICLLSGSAAALAGLCVSSRLSNDFLRSCRAATSAALVPCASVSPRALRPVITGRIDLRTLLARAGHRCARAAFASRRAGVHGQRSGLLAALGHRILQLVNLSGQSTALIGRRAAAFELRERLERIAACLVKIELALRILNLQCDRVALARWRFRKLRLQIRDVCAERVR